MRLLAVHFAQLDAANTKGDVCWLGNHPVARFEVTGRLVSVHPRVPCSTDSPISFTLDDGTGLIECVLWCDHDAPEAKGSLKALVLGAALRVLGRVRRFERTGQRQLTVDSFWVEVR